MVVMLLVVHAVGAFIRMSRRRPQLHRNATAAVGSLKQDRWSVVHILVGGTMSFLCPLTLSRPVNVEQARIEVGLMSSPWAPHAERCLHAARGVGDYRGLWST